MLPILDKTRMDDRPTVNWDRPKLERFKTAYEETLADGVASGWHVFTFDGNEYVVDYAKYLIAYLEEKL